MNYYVKSQLFHAWNSVTKYFYRIIIFQLVLFDMQQYIIYSSFSIYLMNMLEHAWNGM